MGSQKVSKYFSQLSGKNLIVFTVGLSNPKATNYKNIINKNFTDALQKSISFFHLRGAIDYKKLTLIHRMMMLALKNKVKKSKDTSSSETNLFLETYGKHIDFTDKASIKPLVDYLKDLV